MIRLQRHTEGYTLLELMVVIGIIAILAAIALPRYLGYTAHGRAAACLANRGNIEMEEREAYLGNNQAGLIIDGKYRCPSGGTYVWLVSDPTAAGYPMVVCSLHGPATTPPADTVVAALFSSSFDSMDGLTLLKGKWEIQDDTLINQGKGEHRLVFGDTAWTDYTTTVKATLEEGKGYGLYYRVDGEKQITGYCFQYEPGVGKGAFVVREVINGKQGAPIQRVYIPDGYPVYGQSHEMSVAVSGDRHVISIDGEVVMDFSDDTFASGAAGLRTLSKSPTVFESITVSAAGS